MVVNVCLGGFFDQFKCDIFFFGKVFFVCNNKDGIVEQGNKFGNYWCEMCIYQFLCFMVVVFFGVIVVVSIFLIFQKIVGNYQVLGYINDFVVLVYGCLVQQIVGVLF